MDSVALRDRFLSFFSARGHTVSPSDSLIPSGDPTVLFTSAGMNQFKEYFLGKRTDLKRAVSSQKCLRMGDLEHVGVSASHHSFFEMLGNFSFGDYFKAEAIAWAWEFLTGTRDYQGTPSPDRERLCLALPANRLWVSIYTDDDEAFQLWHWLGVPEDRIKRFGEKDNFWPASAPTAGPNGPCGPCSEIYYDPDGRVDGPKSVEIWNLVFTQFDRQPDGSLAPLPKPNIDTGMGLERLASVVQGAETDYGTDLFRPIVDAISKLPRRRTGDPARTAFAERAIADHLRAIVFLIVEGLLPSNESRGYVLRLLIRRAHRLGRAVLDVQPKGSPEFLASLVSSVERAMRNGPYARELVAKRRTIERVITHEETQFIQTLEVGVSRLEALIEQLRRANAEVVPGEEAFKLYDTFGFPVELTADVAREHGMSVDRAGFDRALKVQQERSRSGSQFSGGIFVDDVMRVRATLTDVPSREEQFVGYKELKAEGRLLGLWDGSHWVERAAEGQDVGLVLDRSPFYGESGGQVGDTGRMEGPKGAAEVRETAWVDEVLVHHVRIIQGTLRVQDPVLAVVDQDRRLQVARSHTATHMLHWALRKVLGPETAQAGSLVDADRLRFDFSSLQGLQEEQRREVEALVNSRVRLADGVMTVPMPIEQAKRGGALAFFGDKYGREVRVVTIGDYSKELCGGTHLLHTGYVGTFTITGESSIAAGTRRIEALVGGAASLRLQEQSRVLHEAAARLGRPAHEIAEGLEELLDQLKRSERERNALRLEVAKVEGKRLMAEGKRISGVTFVAASVKNADRAALAAMADAMKSSLDDEGVIVLASGDQGRATVVMATTSQLAKRVHAGQLLKAIAPIMQGSGGGRPEFAQGGGKDPSRIPAALKRAEELVREALAA